MCRPRSAIRSLSWERRAVSLWTKYVVPHEMKPRIYELRVRRSQIYFSNLFCQLRKNYYRVVSVGSSALTTTRPADNLRPILTTFSPSSPPPQRFFQSWKERGLHSWIRIIMVFVLILISVLKYLKLQKMSTTISIPGFWRPVNLGDTKLKLCSSCQF